MEHGSITQLAANLMNLANRIASGAAPADTAKQLREAAQVVAHVVDNQRHWMELHNSSARKATQLEQEVAALLLTVRLLAIEDREKELVEAGLL